EGPREREAREREERRRRHRGEDERRDRLGVATEAGPERAVEDRADEARELAREALVEVEGAPEGRAILGARLIAEDDVGGIAGQEVDDAEDERRDERDGEEGAEDSPDDVAGPHGRARLSGCSLDRRAEPARAPR